MIKMMKLAMIAGSIGLSGLAQNIAAQDVYRLLFSECGLQEEESFRERILNAGSET